MHASDSREAGARNNNIWTSIASKWSSVVGVESPAPYGV